MSALPEKAIQRQPLRLVETVPSIEIAYTIIEAGEGRACPAKTFGIDAVGRPIVTIPGGQPAAGTARRVTVTGAPGEIIVAIGAVLDGLSSREALVCTPPPAGRDAWPFGTKREAEGRDDIIARSRDHFATQEGHALLGLDFDVKAWPKALKARIGAFEGQLSGVVAASVPAFAAAAGLMRASSSAGVRNKRTGVETDPNGGQHRFYVVPNGRDIGRAVTALHKRLILEGWGYAFIFETGQVEIRSPVDVAASATSERLWFEGASVLADDALEHVPAARRPVTLNPAGGLLDTATILALTDAEEQALAAIETDMKKSVEAEAAAKRTAWKEKRKAALIAKGVDPERAAKTVGLAIEQHELVDDFAIAFDDGTSATVTEILAAPMRFHKRTCPDPLEPDYGSGRNLAILYGDANPVRIESQAHGGIRYVLRRNWFDEALEAETDSAAPAGVVPADAFEGYDIPAEETRPETPIDASAPAYVVELNRRHAFVMNDGRAMIVNTEGDAGISFSNKASFFDRYANELVDPGKSKRSKAEGWWEHPKRRQYLGGVDFDPDGVSSDVFNMWRGLPVLPQGALGAAGCPLILQHIREVICDGDPEAEKYLLGWLAHMLQRPGDKPGVAIVLKGKKGVGKDTLGEFLKPILGTYYVMVSDHNHVTGQFNGHVSGKLLLHVEEAILAGDRKGESVLKSLITAPDIAIERKGIDAFMVKSRLRVLMTSNERRVVSATEDERRFFVLNVSDRRRGDRKWFSALRAELEGNGPACFARFLASVDLTNFDVRAVPDTGALLDQKLFGLPPLEKWFYEILHAGSIEAQLGWPEEISTAVFFRLFRDATRGDLRARGVGLPQFGRSVQSILKAPPPVRRRMGEDRQSTYQMPALCEARSAFSDWLGQNVRWED